MFNSWKVVLILICDQNMTIDFFALTRHNPNVEVLIKVGNVARAFQQAKFFKVFKKNLIKCISVFFRCEVGVKYVK